MTKQQATDQMRMSRASASRRATPQQVFPVLLPLLLGGLLWLAPMSQRQAQGQGGPVGCCFYDFEQVFICSDFVWVQCPDAVEPELSCIYVYVCWQWQPLLFECVDPLGFDWIDCYHLPGLLWECGVVHCLIDPLPNCTSLLWPYYSNSPECPDYYWPSPIGPCDHAWRYGNDCPGSANDSWCGSCEERSIELGRPCCTST